MAYQVQTDPTAVFGRRCVAALLDAALVLIPVIMLITSSFEYLEGDNITVGGEPATGAEFCDAFLDQEGGFCVDAEDIDERVYFSDEDTGASTALYWGLTVMLLVILQGFTGWTPGKLVLGIRCVQEDGRACGVLKALVRWLLWTVDGFPYFLPLVGFIVGLTTVGHRRVGDMAAKTFVVRRAAMGSPIVVPGLTAPPPPAGYAGTWGAPPPDQAGATTGWASPTPPITPTTTQPTTPGTDAPQWDEARGTYIQWDPTQGAWMQWDEARKAWSRIPGQ